MYDKSIPIDKENLYFESGKNSPSTIHHFYEKLLKLGDNMNTKTAREIAKSRTEFMKKFIDEFLKEWDGKA